MIQQIHSEQYISDMLSITDSIPIINSYIFGTETETYFCGIYNHHPICLCAYSQDREGDNVYIHHIETYYRYQYHGYMTMLLKYILEEYNSKDTIIHLQATDETVAIWRHIIEKIWFCDFKWDINE